MQARHGLSTAGVPNNSTPSTWDVWGPCFASGGRTKYQTLKSSSVLSLRASTPFCCALSSGGQAMFNEWTTADSQKDCSMANLQQDSAHSAGQKSDTKTLWKNLSSAVTFPTPHGKRVLMIVLHGAHLWAREFWPLKQTASMRKIRFAREETKGVQIPNRSSPQNPLPALQQTLSREGWALQPSPHPLYFPVIWSHGLLCQRRTNIIIIIIKIDASLDFCSLC